MGNKPLVIALDGPGASGKGALGRNLASHFGMKHLDTGKLYRAIGYLLIKSDYELEEATNHESDAANFAVKSASNLDINLLNSPELLNENVALAASIVSAIPSVRKALLNFQRDIASNSNGAVLDGRDIGTIVCPNADFKFFITANLEKRAKRRYKELQKQKHNIIYDDVLQDLRTRDERDRQKAISPLIPADNAVLMDTSDMSMAEVFEKTLAIIESHTSDNS